MLFRYEDLGARAARRARGTTHAALPGRAERQPLDERRAGLGPRCEWKGERRQGSEVGGARRKGQSGGAPLRLGWTPPYAVRVPTLYLCTPYGLPARVVRMGRRVCMGLLVRVARPGRGRRCSEVRALAIGRAGRTCDLCVGMSLLSLLCRCLGLSLRRLPSPPYSAAHARPSHPPPSHPHPPGPSASSGHSTPAPSRPRTSIIGPGVGASAGWMRCSGRLACRPWEGTLVAPWTLAGRSLVARWWEAAWRLASLIVGAGWAGCQRDGREKKSWRRERGTWGDLWVCWVRTPLLRGAGTAL